MDSDVFRGFESLAHRHTMEGIEPFLCAWRRSLTSHLGGLRSLTSSDATITLRYQIGATSPVSPCL